MGTFGHIVNKRLLVASAKANKPIEMTAEAHKKALAEVEKVLTEAEAELSEAKKGGILISKTQKKENVAKATTKVNTAKNKLKEIELVKIIK